MRGAEKYEIGLAKGKADVAAGRDMTDWSQEEGAATRGWGLAGWRGYWDGHYLAENPGSDLSDIKPWHRVIAAMAGIAVSIPIVLRKLFRRG